ncbi:Concanavalin A-like lectin/glucanases superfamily [uncultured Caudovirales phage]|uniref:Concanavalin A-like lectin/glucanases superfamily n=1 Tax=uncultured Caudovirales phage TaxID=2100421 RepID=A0A6J5T0N4_9CAUD|nr:Concanavalin A-like lectin/glucanases superfamily [uncultured Caudovirales phage]
MELKLVYQIFENGKNVIVTLKTNKPDGSVIPYVISGAGITLNDINSINGKTPTSLTGNFIVGPNEPGYLQLVIKIRNDFLPEPTEPLTVTLTGVSPAVTKIIEIIDPPTYAIAPDKIVVDEGDTITYTVTTTRVKDGTILYLTNRGTTQTSDFGLADSLYRTGAGSYDWTVPAGIYQLEVTITGAGGGKGGDGLYPGYIGYPGQIVSGMLPVTPGDMLKVYIGGGGKEGSTGINRIGGPGGLGTGASYFSNLLATITSSPESLTDGNGWFVKNAVSSQDPYNAILWIIVINGIVRYMDSIAPGRDLFLPGQYKGVLNGDDNLYVMSYNLFVPISGLAGGTGGGSGPQTVAGTGGGGGGASVLLINNTVKLIAAGGAGGGGGGNEGLGAGKEQDGWVMSSSNNGGDGYTSRYAGAGGGGGGGGLFGGRGGAPGDANQGAYSGSDGINLIPATALNFLTSYSDNGGRAGGLSTAIPGGSLSFNNHSNYLNMPYSTAFEFDEDNFTIEWWWYLLEPFDSTSGPGIGQKVDNTKNGWVIYRDPLNNPDKLTIRLGLITDYHATVSPTSNAWEHWAVVRDGTTLSWYCNGVNCGTYTNVNTNIISEAASNGQKPDMYIGYASYWGYYVQNSHISNLRIVKGVAVYIGDFEKPTGPLTSTQGANPYGGINTQAITLSTSTSLLLISQTSLLYTLDSSINNFNINKNNNNGIVDYNINTPVSYSSIGNTNEFGAGGSGSFQFKWTVPNPNQDSITIVNNLATFIRTATADKLTEGAETLTMEVRTKSVNGPVVATANRVIVYDKSKTVKTYSITPSVSYVAEGDFIDYRINTFNVPNGTVLYWRNYGTATSDDFTDSENAGVVVILNNVAAFTKTISKNYKPSRTVLLKLRTDNNTNGLIVAVSKSVTIFDNAVMQPPIYSIFPVASDRGSNLLKWWWTNRNGLVRSTSTTDLFNQNDIHAHAIAKYYPGDDYQVVNYDKFDNSPIIHSATFEFQQGYATDQTLIDNNINVWTVVTWVTSHTAFDLPAWVVEPRFDTQDYEKTYESPGHILKINHVIGANPPNESFASWRWADWDKNKKFHLGMIAASIAIPGRWDPSYYKSQPKSNTGTGTPQQKFKYEIGLGSLSIFLGEGNNSTSIFDNESKTKLTPSIRGGYHQSYNGGYYIDVNMLGRAIPIAYHSGDIISILESGQVIENPVGMFSQSHGMIMNLAERNGGALISTINEGDSVTYVIKTINVPNNTILYWTNDGTTNSGDFSNQINSGNFLIQNNQASFTVSLANDQFRDGTETIKINIRTQGDAGPIVATSATILVNDSSQPQGRWAILWTSTFGEQLTSVYGYYGQLPIATDSITQNLRAGAVYNSMIATNMFIQNLNNPGNTVVYKLVIVSSANLPLDTIAIDPSSGSVTGFCSKNTIIKISALYLNGDYFDSTITLPENLTIIS